MDRSNTEVNTSLRCWQEGCGTMQGDFRGRCTGNASSACIKQTSRAQLFSESLKLPLIRHKGVYSGCKALVVGFFSRKPFIRR